MNWTSEHGLAKQQVLGTTEPGELALLLNSTLILRGPGGRCFGGLQGQGQHWTHLGALQPAVLEIKGMSVAQFQSAAILPLLQVPQPSNGSCSFL